MISLVVLLLVSFLSIHIYARQNLAKNKPAIQSSDDFGGDAFLAVDGRIDTNFFDNSCSHTQVEINPWWRVDLQDEAIIEFVDIWRRTDVQIRYSIAVVVGNGPTVHSLENQRCPLKTVHDGIVNGTRIHCNNLQGRYVFIWVPSMRAVALSICEIRVLGTSIKSEWVTNGEGTADRNTPCHFPFLLHGQWTDRCVGQGYGDKAGWCSITESFDEHGLWGGCTRKKLRSVEWVTDGNGTASAGTPCQFPFIFMGKEHHKCIGSSFSGHGWCSTTDSMDEAIISWGGCIDPVDDCKDIECEHGGLCLDLPGEFQCQCKQGFTGKYCENNDQQAFLWVVSPSVRHSIVSPYMTCVFPTIYDGVMYDSCIGVTDSSTGWCAVTKNFEKDGLQGPCLAVNRSLLLQGPITRRINVKGSEVHFNQLTVHDIARVETFLATENVESGQGIIIMLGASFIVLVLLYVIWKRSKRKVKERSV